METTALDQIVALLAGLADAPGGADAPAPLSRALRAEAELWAARVHLQSGRLQAAANVLVVAAGHTDDLFRKAEIANQLLLLAKAWGKPGGPPDSAAQVETTLQAAIELAPALAMPVFARHLERQGRLQEAISAWREAVRLNPQESASACGLARLLAQNGHGAEALAVYLALIEVAPSHKNYLVVAERLATLEPTLAAPQRGQAIKIALLGNATLDHLQSYLRVECYRSGLRPQIYQGGFDQYTQEILDPASGLYAFMPDVLICAIHASRFFPHLHHDPFDLPPAARRAEIDAGLHNLEQLLCTFTARSPALLLVHNMVAPQFPALGLLDLADELGQSAIFAEINVRLAQMARERFTNVSIVDEDGIQARIGKTRATDPRLWLTARLGWSEIALRELTREYTRYLRALRGLNRKCLILDLDNTLWGGVIGEDGLAGIHIGPDAPGNAFLAFQQELEKLWRRGILLAVCSKNNPADALAVFNEHPAMVLRLAHFAAQRINWESKAANIRAIATELNIGLDSLVFLDDNPAERAQVRAELPQVLTPDLPADPAQYRTALLELRVFDSLVLTAEDRNRNQLYLEQRARQVFAAQHQSSSSLDQYLDDLQIGVEIAPATPLTLSRIAQLTSKTNQFNLTTRRYSEAQIHALQDRGCRVYSMRVTDRFGDNGLVGVAILAPNSRTTWEIDTLLLSCRVMGRGVETALLAVVTQAAQRGGATHLQGWYLPTGKNDPVQDCYRRHGFTLAEQTGEGAALWSLDLARSAISVPSWLTVQLPAAVA